jgi:hypothetical protein
MAIYHIKSRQVNLGKHLAQGMAPIALLAVALYFLHSWWPSRFTEKFRIEKYASELICAGVGIFLFESRKRKYDLEVDDQIIRMRGGFGWEVHVRRGRIRYFRETSGRLFREPALELSEHGRIGSFFLGCVWIPASLAEYEQIKNTAMSWRDFS